jgi:hypothetical protein
MSDNTSIQNYTTHLNNIKLISNFKKENPDYYNPDYNPDYDRELYKSRVIISDTEDNDLYIGLLNLVDGITKCIVQHDIENGAVKSNRYRIANDVSQLEKFIEDNPVYFIN